LGIGDWGLGIGAQSPIPNPQSPIFAINYNILTCLFYFKK
jgi:hypothetical protein